MRRIRNHRFFYVLLVGFFAAVPILKSAEAEIRVAITIDDLPRHGVLPAGESRLGVARKMLSALTAARVPEAYGFINSSKLQTDEDSAILRDWREAGYPLGNHTFSHADINSTEIEDFKSEIKKNEATLRALAGESDWHFFRYPYLREGNTLEKRNSIRDFLKNEGYQIAQVTIDFEDWSWNAPAARCADRGDALGTAWLKETYLKNSVDQLLRAELLSKGLFGRSIPHILLLHVGAFDAEMIGELVSEYRRHGVKFITLSEAAKDEVYSPNSGYVAQNGSELTYQVLKARGLTLGDLGIPKYTDYPAEKLESICR